MIVAQTMQYCSAANSSKRLARSAISRYNSTLVRCNTSTQLKITTQIAASRKLSAASQNMDAA